MPGSRCFEPPLLVARREVDLRVHARRDDVELGIEDVDAVHDPVQPRHGEGLVGLVLAHRVGGAGDLLVGRGDDEVGRVHGDEVGRELAGEVVLLLVVAPVEVRQQVLGLLQGVGDGALGHAQALRQQRGHQVAVRVVADDQVGAALQLGQHLPLDVEGELLQVGPDLEARDPVRHDLAACARGRERAGCGRARCRRWARGAGRRWCRRPRGSGA